MDDLDFMREALALAKQASEQGEVPVGCVITRGEEIVGRGYNRRETDKSALAHAEIQAIDEACKRLGGWRLWECTLYVTLAPGFQGWSIGPVIKNSGPANPCAACLT